MSLREHPPTTFSKNRLSSWLYLHHLSLVCLFLLLYSCLLVPHTYNHIQNKNQFFQGSHEKVLISSLPTFLHMHSVCCCWSCININVYITQYIHNKMYIFSLSHIIIQMHWGMQPWYNGVTNHFCILKLLQSHFLNIIFLTFYYNKIYLLIFSVLKWSF